MLGVDRRASVSVHHAAMDGERWLAAPLGRRKPDSPVAGRSEPQFSRLSEDDVGFGPRSRGGPDGPPPSHQVRRVRAPHAMRHERDPAG